MTMTAEPAAPKAPRQRRTANKVTMMRGRARAAKPAAPKARPFTVKVRIWAEVDRAAWDAVYGGHMSAREIRDQVMGVLGTAGEAAFEDNKAVKLTGWE